MYLEIVGVEVEIFRRLCANFAKELNWILSKVSLGPTTDFQSGLDVTAFQIK